MCVIYFSYNSHDEFPLVLIANRDEYYERPTLKADFWKDFPNIYGGRDLVAGGTWLGITENGRFAAVTNYRQAGDKKGTLSRGALVADFLQTEVPSEEYLDHLTTNAFDFSGFNLLIGEINERRDEMFYLSNRSGALQKLEPGIYGLSNHLLDTPWPKIERGKENFGRLISGNRLDEEDLFDLLRDKTEAADEKLPDTGIGIEKERFLSPIFIETPVYGTRCSTIVTIDSTFNAVLNERVYH